MIVNGKFETYPPEIHKLWKEVYFLYGKDAPQEYEKWWGSYHPTSKYENLWWKICEGGVFYIQSLGAFARYEYWGILGSKYEKYFISDKYIDFLANI